ncbi:MAG TPA: DUF2497 domain-containing protein [Caulobacteraceae bacterium]
MPDPTAPEPTMEEILASIRRIISEDDAPEGEGVSNEAAAVEDDDPDYAVEPDEPAAGGDVPYHVQAERQPEPEVEYAPPAPEPAVAAAREDDTLLSPRAASVAASAFSQLSAAASQPRESRTLEDVAKELMAPMLRQWLDENLPRIVQAAVRDEVERISRGRVG